MAAATRQVGIPDRLGAILSSTHDAIVGSTLRGVINRWNQAAAELYGYSAEEIIGQDSFVLIAEDRHDEEAEILRRIIRGVPVAEYRTARGDERRVRRHRAPHLRSPTPPMRPLAC